MKLVRFAASHEYYNHIAQFYDSMYEEDYWRSAEEQVKQTILRYVGKLSGLEVLDVGAGTGNWSLWLAQQGAWVTLVEPAEKMLKIAERKLWLKDLAKRVRGLVCAKIEDFQAPEDYDMILMLGDVLSYVAVPEIVVQKVSSMLRGDGLIIGTVDNYFSYLKDVIIYGTEDDLERLRSTGKVPIGSEFGTFESRGFKQEELETLFEKFGFRILEITSLAVFSNVKLNLRFAHHFTMESEHLLYVVVKQGLRIQD